MKGETIKEIMRKNGVTLDMVASRLGTKKQNISSALMNEDIRTGLMETVAEIMGTTPASFYIGEDANVAKVETAINSTVIGKKDAGCSALEKQLDVKDEQIASLHRIIENMSRTGK